MNDSINRISNALKTLGQDVGVVATYSSLTGRPETAAVYFSYDDRMNIYFTTRSGSRKYQNILNNPEVAFVTYTDNPPRTIQIEDIASIVTDPYKQTRLFSELVERVGKSNNGLPPIDQLSGGEIVFIRIIPDWIRMGDFDKKRKKNTVPL